jgi:hypothetical protein
MTSFTLDTNCIIAVANDEPDARAVRALADAHAAGKAQVAAVAISASENPQRDVVRPNFADFLARLAELQLDHLELLKPLGYWGITFWDWCLWSDDTMAALDRQIHGVLFPNIEFATADFCRRRGMATDPFPWRNAKCDVLALWSHIYHGHKVFVTSDENFHRITKKPALLALGAGQICRPAEAVATYLR